MTTMQTPTRAAPSTVAPRNAGPMGGSGAPTIDPVRLLRQYKFPFFVSGVMGLVLGVLAYYLFLWYAPQYKSTVSYLALPPTQKLTETNEGRIDIQELDRFMQTQAKIMSNERILREACREPRLLSTPGTKWAKQFLYPGATQIDSAAAVRDLKDGMVSAKAISGTQLMELSVTGPTALDAQIIANAVHRAYWDELKFQLNTSGGETKDALEKQIKEVRTEKDRIDNTRKQLVTTNRLEDPSAGSGAIDRELDLYQGREVELKGFITRIQADVARMEEQLSSDSGVKYSDDLREEAERDALVVNLKSEVAQLSASRAAKLKGGNMGEAHPEIKKMDAIMEAKEKEAKKAVDASLKNLFFARLDQSKQQSISLNNQLAEVKGRIEAARLRKQEILRANIELEQLGVTFGALVEKERELKNSLDDLLAQEVFSKAGRQGRMRLLEDGKLPDTVAFPRLIIMLFAGVVLTAGLTGGVIVLREALDQRIKGPSDILAMQRLRLLGLIPTAADDPSRPGAPETAFRDSASGAIAESFRQMRPAIVKRMQQSGHKSLLIVGAMPSSGATTVASNLAIACASAEQKVLVIDANFRRPGLHKVFKLGEGPGLGDVLCRKSSIDEAVQQTSVPNLHLLSAGTPAARGVPERLATEAMTQVVRDAVARYELVIIDTAPMMVAGDGLALANRCDATALVVRAMAEKRGLIARIRDQLGESRGEFLGAIVNAVRVSAGGYMRRNMRASYEYQNNGATP